MLGFSEKLPMVSGKDLAKFELFLCKHFLPKNGSNLARSLLWSFAENPRDFSKKGNQINTTYYTFTLYYPLFTTILSSLGITRLPSGYFIVFRSLDIIYKYVQITNNIVCKYIE